MSFNPNSIGKNPKRSKIIQALRKKNANIVLLSDTRLSSEIEPTVKAEWGGEANFSSYTSQARGVAVLYAKGLAVDIIEDSIYKDKTGNFIVLNIKYETFIITLACIYGPNNDDPEFFRNVVFKEIAECQEKSDFTIIGGDWNISMSQDMDTFGYNSENNKNARNIIINSIENLGLIDIFRYKYPHRKRYSWRQFGGVKRARLDFFLVSSSLIPFVENCDILPGIQSDHSMPVLEIDFSRFSRGRGFFKFNNSLINDYEYVKLIEDTIREVTIQYAEDIYNKDFLKNATPEQLQMVVSTIDPQLFLEVLLFEIRGKTISHCAWKKKCKNGAQNLALHRLQLAEIDSDREPDNRELRRQLDIAREEVENHNRQAAEGAQLRAKTQWHVEGEKPSKFFCNLEKHNAVQKYIPELKVKDTDGKDKLVTDQKKVEQEIFDFYQTLYKSHETKLKTVTIDQFLGKDNLKYPKLSNIQANKLEGQLTMEEATKYIKKCRSDASPGSSGFTGGFYKLFWRNLKYFVVNSLNYAYETGNLSVTQKLGVIILLPKPEKDKKVLANWRPISLLNQVYKILSGALAERLKPALETIIHPDQKGFVSGRYIGECIRNTYDIIEYAKSKNRAGLLLLIDFEKAFDSISHSFIIKCLHFFGFGFSFIKWINVILNNISSCINHCGNISDRFLVGRSCRQGDPISPYLFIICVEILALKIREEKDVCGFRLGKFEKKLDFYADDLTAYLDGSEKSLKSIINILDEFRDVSGLKINLNKCMAVWIGKNRFSHVRLCDDYKLIWTNSFKLLGVEFDSDLANMDTNFRKKIEEIKSLFKCWLFRHLTPLGKVTIIKSLALSKLSHLVLVCPHDDGENLSILDKMIFNFLWNGKPDRMKRCHVTLPLNKGGLNLPDLKAFWSSLKLSWSRRLMSPDCSWQKLLNLNLMYINHEMHDIWFGGPIMLRNIADKLSNPFWKEIFGIFAQISDEIPFSKPNYFYNLNIFDNNFFSMNKTQLKSSEFPSLWNKKICQVGDFFDCSKSPPEMLSMETLNTLYNIKLNFLNFHRLKQTIKCAAKNLNFKIFEDHTSDTRLPRLPLIHKLSTNATKGCRNFYEMLKAREWAKNNTAESEKKWQLELDTTFSVIFWDKIWKLNKFFLCSNKMKWVNLQILRYILPTNYTVNKYNQNQDPSCSFCAKHDERLSTLVWSCSVVREFWNMVGNIVTNYFPETNFGRKEAIFGDYNSKGNSIINTIIILAKQFIWTQKFGSKSLGEVEFIIYMRKELSFLQEIKKFKGEFASFYTEWFEILQHFEVH